MCRNVVITLEAMNLKLSNLERMAQKSKPLPNDQKIVLITLKPANKIRFIRQIKVWIKYYNIIRWY